MGGGQPPVGAAVRRKGAPGAWGWVDEQVALYSHHHIPALLSLMWVVGSRSWEPLYAVREHQARGRLLARVYFIQPNPSCLMWVMGSRP